MGSRWIVQAAPFIGSGGGAPICYKPRMAITLHKGDLPDGLLFGDLVAIDSETMGLDPRRDRLCLVQLSRGDGDAHLVQLTRGYKAPNLVALLADPTVTKLFHYGRFDIAMFERYLGVATAPVYCTKIASKLTRTYTDRHGLRDLCRDLLGVEISKQQQSSDWGADELTEEQLAYAASDVLHLHKLKETLDALLEREGRRQIAEACFRFLPTRARLDLIGWETEEIFAH
jgi:ribonuclease D